MGHWQVDKNNEKFKSNSSSERKKSVSFCSNTSTGTYKTAKDGYSSDSSATKSNYDTDYFSPDEDDEFFDLSPSDDDRFLYYFY